MLLTWLTSIGAGLVDQQLNMVHSSWHKSRLATATVNELTDEMARNSMDTDVNAETKDESTDKS